MFVPNKRLGEKHFRMLWCSDGAAGKRCRLDAITDMGEGIVSRPRLRLQPMLIKSPPESNHLSQYLGRMVALNDGDWQALQKHLAKALMR